MYGVNLPLVRPPPSQKQLARQYDLFLGLARADALLAEGLASPENSHPISQVSFPGSIFLSVEIWSMMLRSLLWLTPRRAFAVCLTLVLIQVYYLLGDRHSFSGFDPTRLGNARLPEPRSPLTDL